MKNKLLLSLLLLLFLFSTTLRAQYLGVQSGVSYMFGLKPTPTVGIHFKTDIINKGLEISANYHLPFTLNGTDYAEPFNNGADRIEISYVKKVSMIDVNFLYLYYFADNSMEIGGLYAFTGINLGYSTAKITPGKFDPTEYYLSHYFDKLTTKAFQPYIIFGLGLGRTLNNDHLWGFQFLLNLNGKSFNKPKGPTNDASLPGFIALRATYTLPLGN